MNLTTTHCVETAGKRSNKFGAPLEMLERVGSVPVSSTMICRRYRLAHIDSGASTVSAIQFNYYIESSTSSTLKT